MIYKVPKLLIFLLYVIIIIITSIRFYSKVKLNFNQLNFDFKNEQLLHNFSKCKIDSVSYNFLKIKIKSKTKLNSNYTGKLSFNNTSYYFRYVYVKQDSIYTLFKGVEWLIEPPKNKTNLYNFSEVKLPIKHQKNEIKALTIGDEFLYINEAKYLRKELSKEKKIGFYGTKKDVLGYSYIATTNLNKLIKDIEKQNNIETYIFFFGNSTKFELISFENTILKFIKTAKNKTKDATIIWINFPFTLNNKINAKNKTLNTLLKQITKQKNIKLIDAYSLTSQSKMLLNDKDLSKKAYINLAHKISKLIK